MKTCRICSREKPLTEFYRRPTSADGYRTECKECKRAEDRRHNQEDPERKRRFRLANLEHNRAYDRARCNTPSRKDADNRYKRSEKWKSIQRVRMSRYRKENAHKTAARRKVRLAVANGILKKLPCECCGRMPTQAHHEDYSKPLVVRWLCSTCHSREHRPPRPAGLEATLRHGSEEPLSFLVRRQSMRANHE